MSVSLSSDGHFLHCALVLSSQALLSAERKQGEALPNTEGEGEGGAPGCCIYC